MAVSPDFFDHSPLGSRDMTQKFSHQESLAIDKLARVAWKTLHRGFHSPAGPATNLRADGYIWGRHPDTENFVFVKSGFVRPAPASLYGMANLESPADILSVRGILRHLKCPRTILASMYFPYSRADRTKIRPDGSTELVFLDLLLSDLFRSGVRGLILVDPHSPALSWFCLKAGIAPLNLSALPSLVTAGLNQGLLVGDNRLICATPDTGGLRISQLAAKLLGGLDILVGVKHRLGTSARVSYQSGDLAKVVGKTVIFADDVISTGATLLAASAELLAHGAARIVILATYPVLAGQASQALGKNPSIRIITTDGYTPLSPLGSFSNITLVPVSQNLLSVLELDQSGVDFWSQTGRSQLKKLGFCLW